MAGREADIRGRVESVIRIISDRPDHFSDTDSFGRIYQEIFGYGNEYGYFFADTKTNMI